MKTINQINDFCRRDQVINMYLNASKDTETYKNNWRNKYYSFNYRGIIQQNTITGNFLFGAAQNQLSQFIYKTPYNYEFSRDNKRAYFELEFKKQFRINASLDLSGVTLYFETNFEPMKKDNFKRFKVKSNKNWDDFDLKEHFIKNILPKYLYKEGLISRIQLCYNCDKQEAKQKYKDIKRVKPEETDMQKAWRKLLKKKNIQADQFMEIKKLKAAYFQYNKQSKRAFLKSQRELFEAFDNLSYEYDTDDEIMNAAEELITNKTLYI